MTVKRAIACWLGVLAAGSFVFYFVGGHETFNLVVGAVQALLAAALAGDPD